MSWLQAALLALSVARELIKYLRKIEDNKKEQVNKLRNVKDGIKVARKTNDTTRLESAFSDVVVRGRMFND